MRLHIQGYAPLELPALLPLAGQFKGDTSYAAKFAQRCRKSVFMRKRLPGKIQSLQSLISVMGDYGSYVDACAGIGVTGRIFGASVPKMYLNDQAEDCRACLQLNFPEAYISNYDAKVLGSLPAADVLLLDYNDFTLRRGLVGSYKPMLEQLCSGPWDWVVLTDCTPFYFRYGAASFKSYSQLLGRGISSIEDYFRELSYVLATMGLGLCRVAYWDDPLLETAFLLLSRRHAGAPCIDKVAPNPDLLRLEE